MYPGEAATSRGVTNPKASEVDVVEDTQVCTGCDAQKPLSDFHLKLGKPRRRCKVCVRAQVRAYGQEHRESRVAANKAYAEANAEAIGARRRRWRAANAETLSAKNVAYKRAQRERLWVTAEEALANPKPSPKHCPCCARVKAVDDFYPTRWSLDGRASRCKECAAAPEAAQAQRVRYAANRDQVIKAVRQWQIDNPNKVTEIRLRRRAREVATRVGDVNLEALWTGTCSLCGDPMDPDLKRPDPLSKSVDHIVPLALGGTHEQANLAWAHLVCNMRKGARPLP